MYGDPQRETAVEPKGELPLWKLSVVALPSLTITVLWVVTLPNAAPYMMRLGMSTASATLINLAGPISGFFADPVVGAVSDSSTCRYGRRRPVVLAGLLLTTVAGALFAWSERLLSQGKAVILAALMYWILDFAINVYMTPIRALIADLASDAQQLTMQAIVVTYQALGTLLAFSTLKMYEVPSEHMIELVGFSLSLNCAAVAVQFYVAEERQLVLAQDAEQQSSAPHPALLPFVQIHQAVRGSSALLRRLCAVHVLVYIGLTAWLIYAAQWFGICVYRGDPLASREEPQREAYALGQRQFACAGQWKSILWLLSSMLMTLALRRALVPAKLLYALCLLVGAAVSAAAAFISRRDSGLAVICMALSVLPQVGVTSIPFGLIAAHGTRAERDGATQGSTALQMGLLNCAMAVGPQFGVVALAAMERKMATDRALQSLFMIASAALLAGAVGAALLDGDTGGSRPDEQVADPQQGALLEKGDRREQQSERSWSGETYAGPRCRMFSEDTCASAL